MLLLLRRYRARPWDAGAVTRELRISTLVTANSLAALMAAGLVIEQPEGNYYYRPARPELCETVDRLAAAYGKYPFAVTQAIFRAPNERFRLFANAFRIRKD